MSCCRSGRPGGGGLAGGPDVGGPAIPRRPGPGARSSRRGGSPPGCGWPGWPTPTRRRRGRAPAGRLRADARASGRRPGRVGPHPRGAAQAPQAALSSGRMALGLGRYRVAEALPPPRQPGGWRRRRRGVAPPRGALLDDGPARRASGHPAGEGRAGGRPFQDAARAVDHRARSLSGRWHHRDAGQGQAVRPRR